VNRAGSLANNLPQRPQPSPLLYSRWISSEITPIAASELAQSAGLPLIIAELLLERGVRNTEEAERFLHPGIDHLLDPYTMHGMTEAIARIRAAVERREPILIYGDYDVDGTTAVVLLKTTLELLGGVVRFHLPHRIHDGYGMQGDVLARALQEGVRLVISVDSGIRAFAAAERAESLGLDLIITDHHLPQTDLALSSGRAAHLPHAFAILNPNQPGCSYLCKHLCGAGVAFKLAQALLEAHDFERARAKILPSFLKLLAIATVADAVPLLGENRVFLSLGLEQLRRPVHPGLRRLFELAKLDPAGRPMTAADIAFRVAPRINAAGRMDVASDVIELFTTRDAPRARELAEKLDRLNNERRQAETAALEQIERRLEEEAGLKASRLAVIDGEGWHRGVIGILASRVVDRTRHPAIVIAHESGEAHGSGRSIPGFHLLNAIESCRELFTRFGGHAHAVGFSLPSEKVVELRRRLEAWAAVHGTDELPGLRCHALLPLDQVTPAIFGWLQRLEPWGMSNPEPVFVAHNVRVSGPVRTIKTRHVRLRLAQGARANFPAVGWDWAGRIEAAGIEEGSVVHLAYKLKENHHPSFGGLELEIADLSLAV
jgi:single-stranded-DNA-specific exonuclease